MEIPVKSTVESSMKSTVESSMKSTVAFAPISASRARIMSERATIAGPAHVSSRVSGLLAVATRAVHSRMSLGMYNAKFRFPGPSTGWSQVHTNAFLKVLCDERGFTISWIDDECILILW